VYPIQFNWTDNLRFIAREELAIEYIWQTKIVDHWAFGPHHVWTYPESGQILRMWQPFNGLEVFPAGMNPSTIDPKQFSESPPKVCTKDAPFGTIRVKCTDDGYPQKKSAGTVPASKDDLRRAVTKVPRNTYRGDGFSKMSAVLNNWLQKDGVGTKPCSAWTTAEIQRLQAQLYLLRNEDLDGIYKKTTDNRRLRFQLHELETLWSDHNLLAFQESLDEMHRDGHCHEAVMWYVHHLDEDVKAALRAAKVEIPLLSAKSHVCSASEAVSASRSKLCRVYEEKVSCASCHSNVLPGNDQVEVVV
jgi:hypothetical protein